MLLASFLANDAAASFVERRPPPAAFGVQPWGGSARRAESEVLAGPASHSVSAPRHPPEVVTSPRRGLTPWSAGGPRPARATCDHVRTRTALPRCSATRREDDMWG